MYIGSFVRTISNWNMEAWDEHNKHGGKVT